MAPLPCCLVGYPVSLETIEQYRALQNLPKYNDRLLVQDLESKIGVPLALVDVDRDDRDDGATSDHYLCCFVDYRYEWLSTFRHVQIRPVIDRSRA